jgi:N-acetylmuramoyl-L-alanine amidase
MLIVIDQGHGGKDPGASGNNLVESDLTGQLGDIVKRQLEGYDCEVQFTPRGTLSERAAFANTAGADLFVSIHINAGGGTGYESHAHPGASEATLAIATSIHTTMAAFYSERGFRDRGLKRSNFAVLRETKMPAVLLENLFIDGVMDSIFLKDNVHAIGNEIAYAIVVAMGLQAKKAEPVDEVAKLKKILDQRDIELAGAHEKNLKLDMEVRRLRQVIKQAGATLAPEMV